MAFRILGMENKICKLQYPVRLRLLIGPFFRGHTFFQISMPGYGNKPAIFSCVGKKQLPRQLSLSTTTGEKPACHNEDSVCCN